MSGSLAVKEKVQFRLEQDDDYPPVTVESIWVRALGGARYVDNIPFYAYGVGPGDQISVREDSEGVWFDKVVKPSGASVFRIFAKNRSDIPTIRATLLDLSCPSEVDAQMGLIAVEIPTSVNPMPLLDFLMTGQEIGQFDFEEGVLRHVLAD